MSDMVAEHAYFWPLTILLGAVVGFDSGAGMRDRLAL
ncbi:MAG: hypothetical protein QOE77_4221 [Blastocatellia bacterium]|nr:hypothetical protein [Blastocatellia bacterium]